MARTANRRFSGGEHVSNYDRLVVARMRLGGPRDIQVLADLVLPSRQVILTVIVW